MTSYDVLAFGLLMLCICAMSFIIGGLLAEDSIHKKLLKGEFKFKHNDKNYIARTKEIVPKETIEVDPQ